MEFINNWYKTAKAVIFHPKEFFKKMPTSGGYKEPLMFALINIFIAGVFISFPYRSNILVYSFLVLQLILGSIAIFIIAAVLHPFLKLEGAKKNYEATFRAVAYLSIYYTLVMYSNLFFYISSSIGVIVYWIVFLYTIYVLCIAFDEVHEIKSLPPWISVILTVAILVILAIMIKMFMTS